MCQVVGCEEKASWKWIAAVGDIPVETLVCKKHLDLFIAEAKKRCPSFEYRGGGVL